MIDWMGFHGRRKCNEGFGFLWVFLVVLFFKLLCYGENFHPLLTSVFLRGDVKPDVSQNSFKKPVGVPEPHK